MAGRALLVCALCVLCCAAGGVGAWDGGYCTESDWRDLRAVARDMTEEEIEGKYCSRKPEFVTRMRASVQEEGETVSGTTPGGMSSTGAREGTRGEVPVSQEGELPPRVDGNSQPAREKEKTEEDGTKGREEEQSREGAPAASLPPLQSHSQLQDAVQESTQASGPPKLGEDDGKAGGRGDDGKTEVDQRAKAGSSAEITQQAHSAGGGATASGRAGQPTTGDGSDTQTSVAAVGPGAAAGNAADAPKGSAKATHGDGDGSTAASHCISPLALLLLLACAAAAAMLAA
ncbi:hypothetical protein TraAM80_07980 [Trypanosoma rangeli]|uniref:Mucin-associated surface protein (MASP) n=1 Tax=Trypanosoma rangeli TaxID=5698 RepID=A0A422N333_TRYRA|nr:uncharacterized protein TraAM80_07980 [Trypanosoma rangeli]RNE99854.1 hypothetical protein TraAM80_07980 [Trypanosoma rangeli]|eukprot:RNE99854.1 hypothetical protein TraAM80_07980 [Trypanosoma rangeli]